MPEFEIPIVQNDLVDLWRNFWCADTPSPEAEAAAKKGLLGRTVMIEAESKSEAEAVAEAQYPGHKAMRDSVRKA